MSETHQTSAPLPVQATRSILPLPEDQKGTFRMSPQIANIIYAMVGAAIFGAIWHFLLKITIPPKPQDHDQNEPR